MRAKLSMLPYLILATMMIGAFSASVVLAHSVNTSAVQANSSTMSAIPASAPLVSMHTVDMSRVPAASPASVHGIVKEQPITGVSPAIYAQRKAAAAHNPAAPVNVHPSTNSPSIPSSPTLLTSFNGQEDSASTCPYWGGCEHPDMALATSSSWVFQGVNEAYAVYDTHGNLQSGWPKNYVPFFGVPAVGSCDSNGPYMVDPRAFYDPVDQRFWAVTLQDEGAFGYNNCPFASLFWIAVSQTNNPNGKWNVYSFDMARGTSFAADYTEAGFNQKAVFFTSNMLNKTSANFIYAEAFAASKAGMEAGQSVTAKGFTDLKAGGTVVDSVQPVEKMQESGSEFLVSSFNINSGGGSCVSGCSGIAVWAFANPTTTPQLTEVTVPTSTYTMPPKADEPGHSAFIETFDTRIGGSPVYQSGLLSFSFETGVNNGHQVVPGIFWGQIKPTLSNGKITGATLTQSGLFNYSGDQDASYSALGSDANGHLLMAFVTMSSSINPTIMYATHTSANAPGTLSTPVKLIQSSSPKVQSFYGDYSNTSFDGSTTNDVWFAAEYVSTSDWNTYIGEVHF